MKSLFGLSRSLLADLRRLHPDVKGLDRDLRTIEARIKDEGVGFLSVALPAFGKAFDQSLASGRMAYIPGFARCGEIPKFLSGILCHVFDTKTGLLKTSIPVDYISSIRQVCYFFKKYLPADSRASKLEKSALRDFEETEGGLVDVCQHRLSRFGRVCSLLLPQLDEFRYEQGRHGPGAVLEGYTPNQKWQAVYDGLLDFDHRLLMIGYDLPASLLVDNPIRDESIQYDLFGPSARLVNVPKSCSALRTITVEPCLNQFVQQSLNLVLRREILSCQVLRNTLTLDSQVPNQELALEGSRSGDWCTVDLSAASDRLTTEVVRRAFAMRPRFLEALLACRTPSVDLPHGRLLLKKYAGMGNATTFPVQSVVFAALALTAIVGDDSRLTYRKLIRASKCVRVFGDDIIIKREYYSGFADWINSFGLKINQGKTFVDGNFRESCGVDAYMGVDVTPVYLRHDPEIISPEPNVFVSLVSTSNQLWMKAYYETSDYLKKIVEGELGSLPIVSKTSAALGWHTRRDDRSYQRWSRALHRFEVKSYVPSPKRRSDILTGMPALIKFFHLPRIAEESPDHMSVSVRKFKLNLRKRWVQS